MGKKFLSVSILFIWTLFISAQQVYQSSDYGAPGTIYLYNRLTGLPPAQELILSGDSVTWDLRAFNELNTHTLHIVTTSQGIDQLTFLTVCTISGFPFLECFNIWSQTDQALVLNDSISLFGFTLSDLKRFQNKTQNLLLENFFGFTVDLGEPTPVAIVYQNPDTILQFPLQYNDSWTSAIEWGIDLSPAGQNIMYRSNQYRSSEVDAWGSLITPYDTFTNVIRLRSEVLRQDTLFTDTMDIPVEITQVEYMWFATSYKLPVMTATGIITDTLEIISLVEYLYDATCPPHEWAVDTGSDIFYLDESGTVTVPFIISGTPADEYEWDFGDGSFETGMGNTTHTYELPGLYSVGVLGCMKDCLPLNSCSAQIVDFEIIDTFQVAVPPLSADEVAIKLYPNPAEVSVTLEIAHLPSASFNYVIRNIWGRPVSYGTVYSEKQIFDVSHLPPGIYSIHLTMQVIGTPSDRYLRFAVIR